MNINIAMIVIFLLIIIIIVGGTFFQYRKHKSNLDSHLNSLKFFPQKTRFTIAIFFYYLFGFILFSPIYWIIMRQGGFPFYYSFFFLLIFLPSTISEYPCFTLSIDDKKMRGARLLGGWSREEIFLSEINQDKVLQKNLVGFLGITIFYSTQGKKILTLGLDNGQITKILELAKSSVLNQDRS
jgi:hypothetical protein